MFIFQLGFFSYEVLNEILSFIDLILFSISAAMAVAVILITIHFSSRGMRILDVTSKVLGSLAAAAVIHDKISNSTNGGESSGDDKNKDDKNKKTDKKSSDNKSSDGNKNTNNEQSSSSGKK